RRAEYRPRGRRAEAGPAMRCDARLRTPRTRSAAAAPRSWLRTRTATIGVASNTALLAPIRTPPHDEIRTRGDVMSIRPVNRIVQAQPTIEGAGVKLRRAFGFGDTKETDPFLLFDDFRNERPADYLAGFPWHPHRGIETITYVLAGSVS